MATDKSELKTKKEHDHHGHSHGHEHGGHGHSHGHGDPSSSEINSVKIDPQLLKNFIDAAKKGDIEDLGKILTQNKHIVNEAFKGMTALQAACLCNHHEAVEFLIEHGAYIADIKTMQEVELQVRYGMTNVKVKTYLDALKDKDFAVKMQNKRYELDQKISQEHRKIHFDHFQTCKGLPGPIYNGITKLGWTSVPSDTGFPKITHERAGVPFYKGFYLLFELSNSHPTIENVYEVTNLFSTKPGTFKVSIRLNHHYVFEFCELKKPEGYDFFIGEYKVSSAAAGNLDLYKGRYPYYFEVGMFKTPENYTPKLNPSIIGPNQKGDTQYNLNVLSFDCVTEMPGHCKFSISKKAPDRVTVVSGGKTHEVLMTKPKEVNVRAAQISPTPAIVFAQKTKALTDPNGLIVDIQAYAKAYQEYTDNFRSSITSQSTAMNSGGIGVSADQLGDILTAINSGNNSIQDLASRNSAQQSETVIFSIPTAQAQPKREQPKNEQGKKEGKSKEKGEKEAPTKR